MDKKPFDEAVLEIAKQLGETKPAPIKQIQEIVDVCGIGFAQKMLQETLQIEENGGMKIHNKKRRRTPGGVFFYVCKGKMDPESRKKLFPNMGETLPKLEWEERIEFMSDISEEDHGTIRTAIITIKGHAGKIKRKNDSVIMILHAETPRIPFPRGVPNPPAPPKYTVYLSWRQWEPIAERLKKTPEDPIVINGVVVPDPETNTLAVFTTYVTTKQLLKQQKQRNESQQPKSRDAQKDSKKPEQKAAKKQKAPSSQPPQPKVDIAPTPKIKIDGISDADQAKLNQLQMAADTLRKRIATMKTKGKQGQSGLAMTEKLLSGTEQQIQVIVKKYQ